MHHSSLVIGAADEKRLFLPLLVCYHVTNKFIPCEFNIMLSLEESFDLITVLLGIIKNC